MDSVAEFRHDWRAQIIGESSPRLHSDLGESTVGDFGIPICRLPDSRLKDDDVAFSEEAWPSIEQGIRQGKGAQRRLTLAPNQHRDWIVDNSGYHPSTHVRSQIAADIKRHLFCDGDSDSQLGELADACDRLEASMGRMLALGRSGDHGDLQKSRLDVAQDQQWRIPFG